MKKILIYSIIFVLIQTNLSYSAQEYDKFSLINAAKNNSILKTKLYLAKGYDANLKDVNGNTALTYSILNNNVEITKLLIRNGANSEIKDSSGKKIYCSAKSSDDYVIRRLFERYDEKQCYNKVAKKTKAKKVNVSKTPEQSGFLNWKNITAGIVVAGGAVALFSGGGGGGGNDTSDDVDTEYDNVGDVSSSALNSILSSNQYDRDWLSLGIIYNNYDDYNLIRLAYAYARGYTGKIKNPYSAATPYYLSSASGTTSLSPDYKIRVAIMDSGVQLDHPDLIANISTLLANSNIAAIYCSHNPSDLTNCPIVNTNVNDPTPSTLDSDSSHGTFLAGLIGAEYNSEGIMGIASDSELIPYRLTSDAGNFVPYYYIGQAFETASNNDVTVINNSYGLTADSSLSAKSIATGGYDGQNYLNYVFGDYDYGTYYGNISSLGSYSSFITYSSNFITQIIDAVSTNDVIFVFSAGNDSYSQSSIMTAVPLYFSEFYDSTTGYYKNFINVVAYDTSAGTIASYSNACGVTAQYCLTAPGTDLVSTSTADGYALGSGTSFAAPTVTGAVAVLKGAFPYLTGAEITRLLFVTARDLGITGVDEVYGWGMLDLERATRPVGATLVPIDTRIASLSISLLGSSVKLSSTFANSLQNANLSFVILDDFNRTFTLNLNDYLTVEKSKLSTIDVLNNFGSNNIKTIALNKSKSFNFYSSNTVIDNHNYQELEFSNSIDSMTDNNYGFNFYFGNNPYNAFIGNKVDFYNNYSLSKSYNYNILNPYFKANSDYNFGLNNIIKLNDNLNVNFGVLYQDYAMSYQEKYYDETKDDDLGSSFSALSGLTYNLNKNVSTKIEFGLLNEYNTILGSQMNGAFGIGENNLTYMASLQNDIKFNDKFSVFGKANFGWTEANTESNLLIKDFSTLYSNSFAIGMNYNINNEKNKSKNISLLIFQPVQIKSGNMQINLPVARDMDGNIYYQNNKVNLKDKNEIDLQLAYNKNVTKDSSFNLGVVYKDYLDNEAIFLLKYKKLFNF
ncbi:MAG: S8 family serine peptidase [Rickettsiales bacterium]|nr:S8 family serine peptidase [Rickettsiales bacterium]